MAPTTEQHLREIDQNRRSWESKPLLRRIYREFYQQIERHLDRSISGRVVELGSGMGNLREVVPEAICTDLFPNPWLDLVCDGYHLPFRPGTVSHLILFDVFHHLERPCAFLAEARRVLVPGGRLILFEPYISAVSALAYGLFHHEPVGWRAPIDLRTEPPPGTNYYAAQGNATRLFFSSERFCPEGWQVEVAQVRAALPYLLSGGFSRPAFYPAAAYGLLQTLDRGLSLWPRLFGGRCLVVLRRAGSERAAKAV